MCNSVPADLDQVFSSQWRQPSQCNNIDINFN